MLYMVTFTINIPQMLAYIPYMDPMGYEFGERRRACKGRTIGPFACHLFQQLNYPATSEYDSALTRR